MREKRNKLIHDMRQLLEGADREGRAMTAEEITKYDALEAEATQIGQTLERMERLEASGARAIPAAAAAATALAVAGARANGRASNEYRSAFMAYLIGNEAGDVLRREGRVMVEGTAASGGYGVPEAWEPNIIKVANDFSVMSTLATVRPGAAQKINVPVISAFGAGGWTAEAGTDGTGGDYNASDDTMTEVEITAYKGTRLMKVSEELLSDAIFPVDAHVQESIGRALGTLKEAAFVNGNGTGKPTGVVVGSGLGVTAASATAITWDEVMDLYHSVAAPYRVGPKVGFMCKDSTVKILRKLKGGDGQYIWQPGTALGKPDTILGKPLYTSEDMPAATTGLKSMLFGDFSYYLAYERPGIAVQRLNELYSAGGMVGFRAAFRVGGKLTLSAAVKHLIQA